MYVGTNLRIIDMKIWELSYWNKESARSLSSIGQLKVGVDWLSSLTIPRWCSSTYSIQGTTGWETHFTVLILMLVHLKLLLQYKFFIGWVFPFGNTWTRSGLDFRFLTFSVLWVFALTFLVEHPWSKSSKSEMLQNSKLFDCRVSAQNIADFGTLLHFRFSTLWMLNFIWKKNKIGSHIPKQIILGLTVLRFSWRWYLPCMNMHGI